MKGGGGGGGGVVSYPDPNVRNDDHRLQYDISLGMVLGMSLECTLVHNSCVITNSNYVTNSKSIMDYCKVCRTSVANDRSRRLLQNHASCKEGIAVLVCQLSCRHLCRGSSRGIQLWLCMQEVLRCSHKVPGYKEKSVRCAR